MPTVSYGIAVTADDAFSAPSLAAAFDTGVLAGDLGGGNPIWGAVRFTSVLFGVDPTVNITAATLKLTENPSAPSVGGGASGTNLGRVFGVAQANASAITPSGIPALSKGAAFTALTYTGSVTTLDVLAQAQEWKARGGWSAGNALAFVFDPSTATAGHFREFFDYATDPTKSAVLEITYEAGGPDVTAPTITSASSANVFEGDAFSLPLTADEAVTWTKTGGADQALFTLTGSTLSMAAKTYLSPTDADTNNTYVVQVTATDAASNATNQTITVTVTQAPLRRCVGTATGTTSVTIPPHQAGDLILAFAPRDGSNTLPTLPTGQDWASVLAPVGANTISARVAAKTADGSSETTGTFTSATSLIVEVWRPRPGYVLSIGDAASATGASTTVSYPALTLQDPSGNSVVVGFAAHRSVNTTLESPPTGMINRAAVLDATDEAVAHDTDSGVSSWPLTTKSVGGTSSGWFGATVEIKVAAAGAAAYTLTAAPGAYVLTGGAANLLRATRLTADPGSYALTGNAAALRRGYRMAADAGAYTLTGSAVAFTRASRLAADPGSFSLVGGEASFIRGWRLEAEPGAYAVGVGEADLVYASAAAEYSLMAEAGLYVLEGGDASFIRSVRLEALPGSFDLVGGEANLVYAPSTGRRPLFFFIG